MRRWSSGTRAGDADRNRTIDALANAFSEGQLTQPEYDERSSAALRAPTLAELGTLTQDLQEQPASVGEAAALPPTHTTGSGPLIGPAAAARLVSWALRLQTVVVLVALVLFGRWLFGGSEEPASAGDAPTVSTEEVAIAPLQLPGPPEPLTADGLDAMVRAMRRELASTTVTALHLQDEYASFEQRRPGKPGTYSYHYDGFLGVPTHDATGSPDGRPVDLADIDTRAVQRLVDGLPRRLGIAGATTRYVTLEAGRRPRLRYYLSAATASGWLVAGPDGDVLEVHRP